MAPPSESRLADPSPAAPRVPTPQRRFTLAFLGLASAVALYVCYVMMRPFLKPVAFAAVMAVVFYPLHERIRRWIRGANLAAFISTLAVLIIAISPLVGLGKAMSGEISAAYSFISQKTAAGGGWAPFLYAESQKFLALVGRHIDLSGLNLRAEASARLERLSAEIVSSAAAVVSNLGAFLFDAAISFFTLFFLFREGRRIRVTAAAALPLDRDRVDRLFTSINDVIVANVYGVLVVAGAEGALLGIGFLALGVSSPILWGVVTAACSLVPFVGTSLVWIPAALILAVSGHWVKGIIILAWGAALASFADNILRPAMVGGRTKMNTLFVFFGLLGGIEAFGMIGIFVGPLTVSVTFVLVQMLREEGRRWSAGVAALPNPPVGPEATE